MTLKALVSVGITLALVPSAFGGRLKDKHIPAAEITCSKTVHAPKKILPQLSPSSFKEKNWLQDPVRTLTPGMHSENSVMIKPGSVRGLDQRFGIEILGRQELPYKLGKEVPTSTAFGFAVYSLPIGVHITSLAKEKTLTIPKSAVGQYLGVEITSPDSAWVLSQVGNKIELRLLSLITMKYMWKKPKSFTKSQYERVLGAQTKMPLGPIFKFHIVGNELIVISKNGERAAEVWGVSLANMKGLNHTFWTDDVALLDGVTWNQDIFISISKDPGTLSPKHWIARITRAAEDTAPTESVFNMTSPEQNVTFQSLVPDGDNLLMASQNSPDIHVLNLPNQAHFVIPGEPGTKIVKMARGADGTLTLLLWNDKTKTLEARDVKIKINE